MRLKEHIPPALVLFLLSPIVGELLSGSSPPAEFFTVFGFTIMSLLYGGGAILCRELKVKWKKGMGSLVLLGAAYGVIEEGLMVASFQNPGWGDLGVLASFGRIWGINLVWAVELTIYHAFVSIIIPIILVELQYPERKTDSWLKGRWTKIVPTLFILDVVAGYFIFAYTANYWPPIPQFGFFFIITSILITCAYRLPRDWTRRGTVEISSPRRIVLISFISAFASALTFGVLPNILPQNAFPLIILIGIAVVLFTIIKLKNYNWKPSSTNHMLALAIGPLLLMILFAAIQEFDDKRLDDTSGMLLVGLIFLISLSVMWHRNNNPVRASKSRIDFALPCERVCVGINYGRARADKDKILWGVDEMLERPLEWDKPFGEGKATQITVEALHAHT